jgi:hypothetical protein
LCWLRWLRWLRWLHLFFLPLLRSPLHQLPLGPSVFLGLELVLGPSVFLVLGPIGLVLVPIVLVLVPIGLGLVVLDPSVFLGLGFLGLGLVLIGLGLVGLGFLGLGLGFLGLGLGFLGLGLVGLGLVGLGLVGLVLGWGSSPPNTAIWSVYCVSGNSNTQKNVSTYFRSFIYCYSLYIYLNLFLYGDKLINYWVVISLNRT